LRGGWQTGLEQHEQLVLTRDDLTVEWCVLLIDVGRATDAHRLLSTRAFAPWEGGEGKALAAWDRACAALGLDADPVPGTLGEARLGMPVTERDPDAPVDYFATSLPDLLLFDWPRSELG
jgi:hypothetical protein